MVRRRLSRVALTIAAFFFLITGLPPAAFADSHSYVVQSGDTLSSIASRFSSSVDEIAAANGITDYDTIVVGQQLTIPGQAVLSGAVAGESIAAEPQARPVVLTAPAGANSVLGNNRLLTFYGHPNDTRMGILGELSQDELVAALKRRAATYQALSDRPVVPAIHFIVTVAQEGPGADGKYRAHSSMAQVQEYADLAARNGMLMILDIQVGHSNVREELAPWLGLLAQPHVHLALDPEFDMWPGQLPGIHLGHTNADSINYAQQVLSDIVQQNGIPDKILILHQFTASMLPDKANIADFPHVQIVTDMDGWGSKGLKLKHYEWYVHDEMIEYAGMKLFFGQDTPLMTPEEIMSLDPIPDVIIYQ